MAAKIQIDESVCEVILEITKGSVPWRVLKHNDAVTFQTYTRGAPERQGLHWQTCSVISVDVIKELSEKLK